MGAYIFEWHGDHPALDFVNTLDERLSAQPEERLVEYTALVDFTRQAGLIDIRTADALLQESETPAAQAVLSAALAFREALHNVLQAAIGGTQPDSRDLAQVEATILEAHAARSLRLDASGFTWDWNIADDLARPVWELALSTENLLMSEPLNRLKKCAADDCGVLFVDHSRAGGRRWCSMADCGNRYKVQAFRKRGDQELS